MYQSNDQESSINTEMDARYLTTNPAFEGKSTNSLMKYFHSKE